MKYKINKNKGLIGLVGAGILASAYDITAQSNIPPHVIDSSASGNKVDSITGSFNAWDDDGYITNIVVYNPPAGFSQSITGNLDWSYDPNRILTNHSIAFQAIDDQGGFSEIGYSSIDITNRFPRAISQNIENQEGEETYMAFYGTDPDNDPLSYSIVDSVKPNHGTIRGQSNNFMYNAYKNYFGPDRFQFRAYDGNDSSEAYVDIQVLKTDRPFELLSLVRNETNSTIIAKLQPNRIYTAEKSSDLSNWTSIATKEIPFSTNDFTNVIYNFSDTNTSSFYRMKLEEN